MPSESAVTMWNTIRERVRKVVPEQSFCTWFENADLLALGEDRLEIGAANLFVKSWLERNYVGLVQDAAEETTGVRPEVVVTISPERFRAMRAAQRSEGVHEQVPDLEASAPSSASSLSQASSLPAGLKADFRFESFVPGPCNQVAYAAARRAVAAPGEYTPLLIHGASGLGKTHLAHAIAHALADADTPRRIACIHAEAFVTGYVQAIASRTLPAFRAGMRGADVWIVDDVHLLGRGKKPATQEEFLLTFDDYVHRGAQIVLTADDAPGAIGGIHERLRGRFASGLVAHLATPDAPTREAILVRKARERELPLAPEVVALLAARTNGNVRELEGAVGRLTAMARLMGMAITPATAEAALGLSREDRTPAPRVETIVDAVAEVFGIDAAEIRGRRRQARIRQARQVAILLARRLTHASLAEIGSHFDGRSHATILQTLRTLPQPGAPACPEAEVAAALRVLGMDPAASPVFTSQSRLFAPSEGETA